MYVVSPAEVRGAYFGTSATDRNFEGFTFVDESAAHYMHLVVGQQQQQQNGASAFHNANSKTVTGQVRPQGAGWGKR
jgi:hypothetical protein